MSLDPTLVVDEVIYGTGREGQREHPDNSYLPAATRTKWAAYPASPQFLVPGELRGAVADALAKRKEFVGRCARAGVRIVAGTDGTALGDLLPGFALHRELALLRACGLSAQETLAAATINAARVLGLSAEIGSIEVDKAADIAVWAADPLRTTLRPSDLERVLLEGQCHDPAALLHSLASGT